MVSKRKQKQIDDLIGTKINRWYIDSQNFEYGSGRYKGHYLNCTCECGTQKPVRVDSIISERTSSCGCLAKELTSSRFKGKRKENAQSRHPLKHIYYSMKSRCYNPSSKDYKWYGAKGITVCKSWLDNFWNFVDDMEPDYKKGLEIERLDVEGNYTPSNCTWITRQSQLQNTTRSRILYGFGIKLTVTEWGEFLGFNGKLLDDRINHCKHEEDLEKILNNTFKDKQYTLLYKGQLCTATEIFRLEGFTDGQRNGLLTKHGNSVTALEYKNIDFEVVKPREKSYRGFEESLNLLRGKNKNTYEDHLLFKIENQIEEKFNGI